MVSLILPILIVVAVVNLFLAGIIFSRAQRNIAYFLFGLIALASCAWSISIIGFYSFRELFPAVNWVVWTHLFALLVAVIFFYFSLSFPRRHPFSSYAGWLGGIPAAAAVYLLFGAGNVVGKTTGLTYTLAGGYIPYGIILVAYFTAGYLTLLLQRSLSKNQTERNQVRMILFGSFMASAIALVPDLIYPFLGIYNYTWLGPLCTLIMVITIFIAILRYHLFRIKVIVTEIFTGVIILLLLVELFLSTTNEEIILRAAVLSMVSVAGFLLIRGVYREVETREHIERLAKDLEKANARLKELDRQKTEFVSIASHQLRSPLTAIKGYASLLIEGSYGKLSPGALDAMHKIFDSSKYMALSIEDFLNVSRIELGTVKYDKKELDLGKLLKETVEELAPTALEKNLSLSFKAPDEIVRVEGDIGKLKQVFTNLIDNAMKYTPKGSIRVSVERNAGRIRTAIKDTGVGISKETLPKLFEKFVRAKNANAVNVSGTGLGLFVAKEFVIAHGGTIWAESEGEGKGSTFIVELPSFDSPAPATHH